MTLLLASVTGADEAEIAIQHGADLIDLKDSSRGALGALSPEAVAAAVRAVAGRRPVSAVTGDLPMAPEVVAGAVARMVETGVDYIKVGLFADPRRADSVRALAGVAKRTQLVDTALVPALAESGFAGAMLDTADKRGGRLLDHADMATLEAMVTACRAHGLMVGLAGALEAPDIPRLLLLEPDFLGFRGALCAGHDRTGRIDPAAVRTIRDLIPVDPRSRSHAVAATSAGHPLACGFAATDDPAGATDRIFVHDFVTLARVGAYARERERPQNVRFNVDATIMRHGRAIETMRDVVSYDVIMDGIRLVAAREHVPLIETMAERIAAFMLAQPRVVSVTVKVEKLEVGPGAVGIEITRTRQAGMANIYQLYPAASGAGRPDAAE
jgi:dihydroneopterin aldolase